MVLEPFALPKREYVRTRSSAKTMGVPWLDLRSPITDGLLEQALLESNAQAAEVCLDRHHNSPVEVTIDAPKLTTVSRCAVAWTKPTPQRMNTYANRIDAVESGAYAVSLAVLCDFCNAVTVKRAEQLTGSDFLIVPRNAEDFEDAHRLEVSGTESADRYEVKRRVAAKHTQLEEGASGLPGIASVISFRFAHVVMEPSP